MSLSILQFSNIVLTTLIIMVNPHLLHGKSLSESIRETYTHEAMYITPSKSDLEKAKKLFYNLFSASDFKINAHAWNSLGFEIETIGLFLVIKEKQLNQTGKGVYIFNTSKPSQVVIEAPHRPSDLQTEMIAIQLMEEQPFLAAALNTVHRKKANFTRENMTFFNAFTEAFAEAYPKGNLLQLHGFDGKCRESSTDLILSATVLSPPPHFYHCAECLKKIPVKVSLYPKDIKILGGMKNINAKKFRDSGSEGLFFHLEMSSPLREKLKNNKDFRQIFFGCFAGKGSSDPLYPQ